MFRTTLTLLIGWMIVATANAAESSKRKAPLTAAQSTLEQQPDQELEEILVEGHRPIKDPRKLKAWIERLVGSFSYEGYVERYNAEGVAERTEVHGGSQCARFDKAAAVQCMVNATWNRMSGASGPGTVLDGNSLAPAVVVYGLNPPMQYFGHMQVDSSGVARKGKGWLVDDTMISKDPCADFRDCLRVVRLRAPPDAKVISMRVDLEQNGKLQVRQEFKWSRLPPEQANAGAAQAVAASTKPPMGVVATRQAVVPQDIETWLRKLVGRFRVFALNEAACLTMQTEMEAQSAAGAKLPCPKSKVERAEATSRPADAECQNIGAGPGVRCVMYMDWPERGLPVRRKWYQTLNSSFQMYGFDPLTGGIALVGVSPTLVVGPAEYATGPLKDGKLKYQPECAYPPCKAVEQMSIIRGGNRVLWELSQEAGMRTFVSWLMDRIKEPDVLPSDQGGSTQPDRPNRSPRK
jgi:hypothetical protein